LSLSVNCGSWTIAAGTQLELVCSRGLQLALPATDDSPPVFGSRLLVPLPAGGEPFATLSVTLLALAELTNQKEATGRQYLVSIAAPWQQQQNNSKDDVKLVEPTAARGAALDVTLHFVPAFYTSFNLLTVMARKFLQLSVHVLCDIGGDGGLSYAGGGGGGGFRLANARLELLAKAAAEDHLSLVPLHNEGDELFVSRQYEGSYIWQLEEEDRSDNSGDDKSDTTTSPVVKLNFSIDYEPDGGGPSASVRGAVELKEEEEGMTQKQMTQQEVGMTQEQRRRSRRNYAASFQCQDYRTLFTVQARVEPAKGS
jgi:hypothetical protein